MRTQKVLFLIDSLAYGAGTERQVVELVRRLDRSRVTPFVVTFENSAQLEALGAGCETAVLPIKSLFRISATGELLRLRRLIAQWEIDVIQCFMVKAAIVGVLAGALTDRPVITSRRNMGYWLDGGAPRWVRWLGRRAAGVVANSRAAADFAIESEGLAPQRVQVIYNGVDTERYAPGAPSGELMEELGVPAGAPIVGIVANLRPVKDLPMFLDACAQVHAANDACWFVLVGAGPLREQLEQQAAGLGIGDRVRIIDGGDRVADLLRLFSIACLTSESEGFSNAILEYMAAGLPVAATAVGGNPEAVVDGATGFLVERGDSQNLAAKLLTLLKDDKLRTEMGRAGRRRCEETFSLDAMARAYERFYATRHSA